MPKSEFRLERLLELRRRQEEEAVVALAEEQRKVREAEARLEELRVERIRLDEAWHRAVAVEANHATLARDFSMYRSALDGRRTEVEEDLVMLREGELQARKALEEARKRRRMLDKLRERDEARFREAQRKIEQDVLDEAGSRQSGRQKAM